MEITLILTLELFAWENASANIIIIIAVLLRWELLIHVFIKHVAAARGPLVFFASAERLISRLNAPAAEGWI